MRKVVEWRQLHPDGKKIECERETGLSRHTVLKWWEAKIDHSAATAVVVEGLTEEEIAKIPTPTTAIKFEWYNPEDAEPVSEDFLRRSRKLAD